MKIFADKSSPKDKNITGYRVIVKREAIEDQDELRPVFKPLKSGPTKDMKIFADKSSDVIKKIIK